MLRASKNPHADVVDRLTLKVGEGITGWVAAHLEPAAVPTRAFEDPRFQIFTDLPEDRYEAILSVPLLSRGQVVGVINVQHRQPHEYSATEARTIATIGFLVGAEVEMARLEAANTELSEQLETRKVMDRAKGILQRDLGVTEDEREGRLAANRARAAERGGGERLRPEWAHSDSTGGALDYLITTPDGTIFFQDSMGYWGGIYSQLPGAPAGARVDLAILAAAGRGNIDGEPIQGSVEGFIAGECALLRPRQVILSHHDNFTGTAAAPDLTDLTPVREALARLETPPEVVTMELGGSVTLL